ncbi:unnamed protein product [Ectocarpus sp. 6 AP-2014]
MDNHATTRALTGLGAIVLAAHLMPFVGDTEYLNVASISTAMQGAYTMFTDRRESTGLGTFTSIAQLQCNTKNGYDVERAMFRAAELGRIDAMAYLCGIGVCVSTNVCICLALCGNLDALKWGVDSGAIPVTRLGSKVNAAALDAGRVDIFRWCIELNRVVKMADLERSVEVGGYDHLQWALGAFPRQSVTIAIGVSLSDMPNSLELFKEVDQTRDDDGMGHYHNFLGAFKGGNTQILDYIVNRLRLSSIRCDDDYYVRDWFLDLGCWLVAVDDSHGSHYAYNASTMLWVKQHPYLGIFFV